MRKQRGQVLKGGQLLKGGQVLKGRKVLTESTSIINILLIVLMGILAYNLLNQPQIIIHERVKIKEPKIIVKEIIKEVDDDEEPYRSDVYRPDIKRQNTRKPFNYPTRGPPEEYDMVGFLQDSDDSNKLQQLYGRRTYSNSNNWNYFVKSDQYHQIPIPVTLDGKNCTDEKGCKELQNNDNINILNKEHNATIYKPEPYYYNPHIL